MVKSQLVTLSFFRYRGIKHQWWAMRQMQQSRKALSQIPSLDFFKLLGSGSGNGFSIWPDFSVYAVLCVWKSQLAARKALRNYPVFLNMQAKAVDQFTVYMQSIKCKGSWDQHQPFDSKASHQEDEPLAVITRASIAPKKLFSFWRRVPSVSRRLESVAGVAFSKGIGEIPLLEQATFSIWKSRKHMIDYAYRGKKHREMIKKTYEMNWYTEELFSEFKLLKVEQDWPGLDLGLLKTKAIPVTDL